MTTPRMRRLLPLLVVAALAISLAPAAQGAEGDRTFKPVRRVNVVRELIFPIVGATRTINGFGSCRDNCTREHHGNDILTYYWKGVPVVAAHDGVVTEIRDDGEWCNVQVTGEDGWYTRYVHLNNDTPGYDDRRYTCLPPGLEAGSEVKAGTLIGWVGDSGNAEHTQPHVHFELRMPSGLPVDPYRSLKAATHIRLRLVGDSDPAATTAELSTLAYPEGAPTATLVSFDDYLQMRNGGYAPLELSGPLLLSEWDTMPEATADALSSLQPARVEVVGDLWVNEVLDRLGSSPVRNRPYLERVVAEEITPGTAVVEATTAIGEAETVYDDGIGSVVVETAPPEEEPARAPFSIVFLGDLDELSDSERAAFEALSKRVSTTILGFVEPEGELGIPAFEGLGSRGSRYTLYFPTGDGWLREAARNAAETPPDYGVFLIDPESASAANLNFLSSLVDAPVMPFWR